ncbi:hypothetical protein ACLOJK_011378 [Asimina triloba]
MADVWSDTRFLHYPKMDRNWTKLKLRVKLIASRHEIESIGVDGGVSKANLVIKTWEKASKGADGATSYGLCLTIWNGCMAIQRGLGFSCGQRNPEKNSIAISPQFVLACPNRSTRGRAVASQWTWKTREGPSLRKVRTSWNTNIESLSERSVAAQHCKAL